MDRHGKRILIVDDDEDGRTALRALLEFLGHIVEEADNGKHGFMVALAWQPDVICLDLTLPLLSGYDVARLVTIAFEPARRPVLLAVTGLAYEADRRKAIASGFDAYLIKPYDVAALEAILAPAEPRQPAQAAVGFGKRTPGAA
jgi:CheY-like chemotaxis protein